MSYKDKCLTCLEYHKEMRNIYTSISVAGTPVKLSSILVNFYNYLVVENPNYPKNICINCAHQLTITYSFKSLIDTSAKILESYSIASYEDNFDSEEDNIPLSKNIKESKDLNVLSLCLKKEPLRIFCVECKTEFVSTHALVEHYANNHPVKCKVGRDCEYCHEKFEDFRSLVLHRKLHLKPYLCENCWDGYYTSYELNEHSCKPNKNKEKHPPERTMKQCDQCGKSYPPGYIRYHMLTHSEFRSYSCKFCPKKFKVPGSLHSHILWNHKRTRNYRCEVCNSTFISSSARSSHIRKNHLREKKYSCDSCQKRFFSKSELERHMLSHTGIKNFHCNQCDKSYQTRHGLNVHLKSHSQTPAVFNL